MCWHDGRAVWSQESRPNSVCTWRMIESYLCARDRFLKPGGGSMGLEAVTFNRFSRRSSDARYLRACTQCQADKRSRIPRAGLTVQELEARPSELGRQAKCFQTLATCALRRSPMQSCIGCLLCSSGE
eukprot:605591-Amphidinium_carterae.1